LGGSSATHHTKILEFHIPVQDIPHCFPVSSTVPGTHTRTSGCYDSYEYQVRVLGAVPVPYLVPTSSSPTPKLEYKFYEGYCIRAGTTGTTTGTWYIRTWNLPYRYSYVPVTYGYQDTWYLGTLPVGTIIFPGAHPRQTVNVCVPKDCEIGTSQTTTTTYFCHVVGIA